jgi:methylase of polypeptide subunit release factors
VTQSKISAEKKNKKRDKFERKRMMSISAFYVSKLCSFVGRKKKTFSRKDIFSEKSFILATKFRDLLEDASPQP